MTEHGQVPPAVNPDKSKQIPAPHDLQTNAYADTNGADGPLRCSLSIARASAHLAHPLGVGRPLHFPRMRAALAARPPSPARARASRMRRPPVGGPLRTLPPEGARGGEKNKNKKSYSLAPVRLANEHIRTEQ
jgi:hypothetical protein